ncbi:6-phosphogluconate dehydrogenase [Apiospora kogelbergensis]|uniref:6-phosphogluconate dehydrogenase n=1 Tax=Apiospora kogelbergensis TaxID=1337665 RepID=A0AAW0Q707_9PEZI
MRASWVRSLPGLQARRLRGPAISIARRSLHQLSIAVTGKPSKLELSGHDTGVSEGAAAHDVDHTTQQSTAVILASPEFASWSEDQGFMSQLLAALHQQQRRLGGDTGAAAGGESHMDVLFGVTDGIVDPSRSYGKPQPGLSILYGGTASLLPSLWKQQDKAGTASNSAGDADRASSLVFTNVKDKDGLHAEGPANLSPEVTLPLANTIFQNGRRSTLLASRWSLPNSAANHNNNTVELSRLQEKSQQEIVCLQGSRRVPPRIPLMPLAPARKIVAGLGNIVRQVEMDGVASPASRELEILIPQMLEKRAAQAQDQVQAPRPIGVWAWVIPESWVKRYKLASDVKPYHGNQDEKEWQLVVDNLGRYEELLDLRSRLHKIHFIGLGGIVAPGSYMLFCAEPQHMDESPSDSKFALAVAPKSEELELPPKPDSSAEKDGEKVEVRLGQFGAASSTGLYVSEPWLGYATKIDAPHSVLSWR